MWQLARCSCVSSCRVAMERLEARVRELEEEVGRSRTRNSQSSRTHQQALATVRRLEVHQDEEERCRERMVALVEGLERQVGGVQEAGGGGPGGGRHQPRQVQEGAAGAGGGGGAG